MRKSIISFVTLGLLGSGMFFVACKKKEDPAPTPVATTTTTGGTTSGTTSGSTSSSSTSGTTSGSTSSSTSGTTSGSTSSSTSGTTSGSTSSSTSGTTSGSTSSSTTTSGTTSGTTTGSTTGTSGTTIGGSGTFTVNGATNIPTIMIKGVAAGLTSTITQNANYSLQLAFGNATFTSGSYTISDYLGGNPTTMQVRVVILNIASSSQYWSTATSGTVTVSGNNVTFNNVTLKQYNGTGTVTVSGNYTFN